MHATFKISTVRWVLLSAPTKKNCCALDREDAVLLVEEGRAIVTWPHSHIPTAEAICLLALYLKRHSSKATFIFYLTPHAGQMFLFLLINRWWSSITFQDGIWMLLLYQVFAKVFFFQVYFLQLCIFGGEGEALLTKSYIMLTSR